ncbi:gamma-glutamyl kinase [Pseudooceanicola algae]|uniref:Sulfotransferase family protein n=1 Tax=Pseudooceanicola algae TaxID=1537215 RepID=A0A418SDP9_9RHOB|nr:gamma-glutamyl kinase [Pseudooceanicola algae]QPM89485.1 hypothetical protein PSAL_007060 [Pseudooceanicola algae]
MLVFSKARMVLLSVPKTGTTAYEAALAPHAALVISDPPELKHAPVFRYNRHFRPMIEKFIGEPMDIVAVMREPVSWLGSWYRFRQRPGMEGRANATHHVSFDEFVDAYCRGDRPGFANVGNQAKFLEPTRNGTAVTRLFRYEDPAKFDAFLSDRLGLGLETQRLNVSPSMQLDLAARTEAKLRRKFAEDFALYDSL